MWAGRYGCVGGREISCARSLSNVTQLWVSRISLRRNIKIHIHEYKKSLIDKDYERRLERSSLHSWES